MFKVLWVLLSVCFFLTSSSHAVVQLWTTPVRDQSETSFCWSYATHALIEQRHLQKTGEELNLSEEFIGLANLIEELKIGILNVWEGGWGTYAMDHLIERYGMVPERVFGKKYSGLTLSLAARVRARAIAYKKQKGFQPNQPIPHPDAVKIVADAARVKASVFDPNKEFKWKGKTYTPKSFARDYIGFDSREYATVMLPDPKVNPEQWERVNRMIRAALISGYSVPYAQFVFRGSKPVKLAKQPWNVSIGDWDYDGESKPERYLAHLVLITDFKTKSVDFGAVDEEDAKTAFGEKTTHYAIKNSWGMGTRLNYEDAPKHPALTRHDIPSRVVMSDAFMRESASLAHIELPEYLKKKIAKVDVDVLDRIETEKALPFFLKIRPAQIDSVILPVAVIKNGGKPISMDGLKKKPAKKPYTNTPQQKPPFRLVAEYDKGRERPSLVNNSLILFDEKTSEVFNPKANDAGSMFLGSILGAGEDTDEKPPIAQAACFRVDVNPNVRLDYIRIQDAVSGKPLFVIHVGNGQRTKCLWFTNAWIPKEESSIFVNLVLQAQKGWRWVGPPVRVRVQLAKK